MSGLLTRHSLVVKESKDGSSTQIQYFPLWSSPKYFPEELCFCVKLDGRVLYIPCVSDDVFKNYMGQIKFYYNNTLYYFLSQDTEPGNSESSCVSVRGNYNISRDEYNWTNLVIHLSTSEIYGRQRIGMLYKVQISVIENNTDTIKDCSLVTNSIASKLTGLQNYVNYENKISRGYHYYVHTTNSVSNSKKNELIEITYARMNGILNVRSYKFQPYSEQSYSLIYTKSSGNEKIHTHTYYTDVTIDGETYQCDYAISVLIKPPSKLSDTIRITLEGTDFQQDFTFDYTLDDGFHYIENGEGYKISLLEN